MTELEKSLRDCLCLRCGIAMNSRAVGAIDPDSGFPYLHCVACRAWLAANGPKKESAAAYRKAHKKEWLDNLDLLMGCERDPRIDKIRRLLATAGTTREHTESVEISSGTGCVSYRVTPETKVAIQALRVGVADAEIAQEDDGR